MHKISSSKTLRPWAVRFPKSNSIGQNLWAISNRLNLVGRRATLRRQNKSLVIKVSLFADLAVAHGLDRNFSEWPSVPARASRDYHVDEQRELVAGDKWAVDAKIVDAIFAKPFFAFCPRCFDA